MVFYRTSRGNTVLLLAAVLITLGLVVEPQSEGALLDVGIGLFLFYYVSKLLLEMKVKALNSLEISRRYASRVAEDKSLETCLVFTNRSIVRLSVEAFDNYPKLFRLLSGTNTGVISVPAKGYAELSYEIHPTSVGAQDFGPVRLVTRDIAGLFFYEKTKEITESVIEVIPRERALVLGALSAVAVTAYSGGLTSKRKGEGMEFDGIREYSPGDPYKRIEWLSSARTGHLMVRQLRAETQLNIMIVFDSTETMAYGEAGQTKLDYAARSVASLLSYLGKRGDFIGVTVIRGIDPAEVIPLNRGQGHYNKLLRTLGTLRPEKGLSSSLRDGVMRALGLGGIKGRTLFFVISDLDSDTDLGALKQLIAMHHEVIVVSPYTPLFEAHGLKGLDRMIYSINTSHEWKTRSRQVGEAAKLGIPVLDVGPKDIFSKLVMQVEEMRRKGGS